ncbi:hypothetical protein QOT17_017387 [Balamuthia mandrillaris]
MAEEEGGVAGGVEPVFSLGDEDDDDVVVEEEDDEKEEEQAADAASEHAEEEHPSLDHSTATDLVAERGQSEEGTLEEAEQPKSGDATTFTSFSASTKDKEKEKEKPAPEEEVEAEEKDYHALLEEELQKGKAKRMDVQRLQELCKRSGGILPSELRPLIWKHLLGVDDKAEGELPSVEETVDLAFADIRFDEENKRALEKPESVQQAKRVMAAYYKSKGVAEEEGGSNDLHLLLAPFLLLLNQSSSLLDKTLLQFLSSLVGKYLPLQHNKEKATTACAKQLFRLLLMYHDPALCSHFDQVNCSVHDFTPLWFRRFFATLGPLECVLQLWDFLFVHADPFLHYFLALCIVIANRETLLKHEEKQDILKYLEEITIQSTTQVQQLTQTALELVANTPMSFREQLFAVIFDTNDYNAWLKRFLFPHSAFSTPTCLHVSVQEVAHSSSVTIQRGGVKFFVFDCRPLEQYQHGRLPTAFHLPPRMLLEKPEEFNQLMAEFLPLKGNHFTFLGSGSMEMETYLELIVLQFLQHGFAHVSVVRGGYEALHTFIEKRRPEQVDWNSELTDHDPKKCLVCMQKRSPSSSPSHSSPTMTRTAKVVTPQKDGSQQTAAFTNPLSGVSKSLFSSKLSSSISSMMAGRRATTSTQQEGSKSPEQTVTTKKQVATPNRNERKEEEGEEEEDRPLFTIDEDEEEEGVDKTSNVVGKPRNQTESSPNTGGSSIPINLVSSFWGRSTDNKSKTESPTSTTASNNNQKPSGWLVWGRARSSSNPQEEGKGAEAGENAATRTPFIGEEGKKKLVAAASEAKQQLKKAVSSFLLLEDDEQTNESTANLSLPPRRMEYVPLDNLVEAHPSWIFFACHKVTKDKKLLPWFLVVTFEHLVELRVHPTQRFMVALYRSIALPRILKITFRKKEPKLLAFLVSKTSASSVTKSRSGSVGEEKRSDDDVEKKEESADAAETDEDGEQEKEDKGKDKVVLEGEAQQQQLASNVQTEAAAATSATVTLLYVVQHPTECIQAIADASEQLLASHSATS